MGCNIYLIEDTWSAISAIQDPPNNGLSLKLLQLQHFGRARSSIPAVVFVGGSGQRRTISRPLVKIICACLWTLWTLGYLPCNCWFSVLREKCENFLGKLSDGECCSIPSSRGGRLTFSLHAINAIILSTFPPDFSRLCMYVAATATSAATPRRKFPKNYHLCPA